MGGDDKRYVDDTNMAARTLPKGMLLQKDGKGIGLDVATARSKKEKEVKPDARAAKL